MMGGPVMGGPVVMGGQPSFLQGAMQTAAGVAAGTLAVEGIESMLHGFGGHHGGYGLGGFGGGYGERPVEEVVNNYYGDDREREHHAGGFDNSGVPGYERLEENSGDYSRHEESRFADTGNDSLGNDNYADDASLYDSSADDVQLDDSGSYDDGSGSF